MGAAIRFLTAVSIFSVLSSPCIAGTAVGTERVRERVTGANTFVAGSNLNPNFAPPPTNGHGPMDLGFENLDDSLNLPPAVSWTQSLPEIPRSNGNGGAEHLVAADADVLVIKDKKPDTLI